jgi:Peptidase family M28
MLKTLVALLVVVNISAIVEARPQTVPLSTPDDFTNEFEMVPCNNSGRQEAVTTLFERMGAPVSEIRLEKYVNAENVLVRKPGTAEGVLVVGAHYDKAFAGCGALDNWTGIVAIANIYKSLKGVSLKKTVLFVAFGNEEQGLFGSRGMANAIDQGEVSNYCAMVNIDSLGLTWPQVMDNTSSEGLRALAEEVAKDQNISFSHDPIEGGGADSYSFLRKRIPSVTIHGMTKEWPTILHSLNDRPDAVKPETVYFGYRLALAMLIRLDGMACNAIERPAFPFNNAPDSK